MKAIETVYRGYRFRSRLEARWAVFFDELALKWEYEPEGFELGDGETYLPDFFLPESNLWVEVKAAGLGETGHGKAGRFRDNVGRAIVVVAGDPMDHTGRLFCWDVGDSSAGTSDWDAVVRWGARHRKPDGLVLDAEWRGRVLMADECFETCLDTLDGNAADSYTFEMAARAARQARFEHGQRGAPSQWQRA